MKIKARILLRPDDPDEGDSRHRQGVNFPCKVRRPSNARHVETATKGCPGGQAARRGRGQRRRAQAGQGHAVAGGGNPAIGAAPGPGHLCSTRWEPCREGCWCLPGGQRRALRSPPSRTASSQAAGQLLTAS